MSPLDELRMEFGRRRDRPGQAPLQYNAHDAEVWLAGYVWAMNEAANVTARQKWDAAAAAALVPAPATDGPPSALTGEGTDTP